MEYKIVFIQETGFNRLEMYLNELAKDGWVVKSSLTDKVIIMERYTLDIFIDKLMYMSKVTPK